ncbi:MAG TPA: hypothetical protein VIF60_12770 [Burkholderiaceae bacterium]
MESMKTRLKRIVRIVADWPVIGRVVRIGVALYRLPESNARQHLFFKQQAPALLQLLADIERQQRDAGRHIGAGLPGGSPSAAALQDPHAQIVTPQAEAEGDRHLPAHHENLDNLALSLPVTLRKMTRELAEMRALLGNMPALRHVEGVNPAHGIVNREKLAAARNGKLRLNLGCGHIALDAYLNVDRRALAGVDVVAEVDALPFATGEIDEIYSAHLIEHFPEGQLVSKILPYWISLLKPGGTFRAVVPDAEAMMRRYATGDYPYAFLREVMFGGQDYDGNFHYNMFTPDSLSLLLREAGLSAIEVVERARQNGKCLEFEIHARRPGAKGTAEVALAKQMSLK